MVGRLRMRNRFYLFLFLFILSNDLISQKVFSGESITVIVDKEFYGSGELLTFHAFITPIEKNGLTSNYVYVDLVAPSGDIVLHQKLKANDHIAKGEIELKSLLTQGVYRLFVYTSSMFGDVSNLASKTIFSIYQPNTVMNAAIADTPFKIITRAEGGVLLAGSNCKIYYEIQGTPSNNEKSIDLIDIDGETVASINVDKSSGVINLTPNEGQSYRFNILHKGNLFPSVKNTGTSLTVKESNETFTATIGQNGVEYADLTIELLQGNTVVASHLLPDSENLVHVFLKDQLPDGFLTVRIVSNDKIRNNREILNVYHGSKIKVESTLNQIVFPKRSVVDLTIRTSKNGEKVRGNIVIKVSKKSNVPTSNIYMNQHETIKSKEFDINDYFIGKVSHTLSMDPGEPEIKQVLRASINKDSPGYSEGLSFIGGYLLKTDYAIETRPENNEVNFKLPDLGIGSDTWFYGFDSFGRLIGNIELTPKDKFVFPTYASITSIPIVNNQVIDYLNQLKQQNTIIRVYGEVKDLEEIIDAKDDADLVSFPGLYEELESFKEFIIGTVPKATVKKKKGVEGVILMPSHSYNKFKNGPLYVVNGIPTFDGPKVLSIDIHDIEHVEIFNSITNMSKYGLIGRNGIFKVFLVKNHNVNLDSLSAPSLAIAGLNNSYNTADNQVLGIRENVNYPDFRNLLYTSSPFYSDVSGTSVFSFHTSDITGTFEIGIFGVTEEGIMFSDYKEFTVEVGDKIK